MSELDDIFKDAAQAEQATFKPEYWDQYVEQFSGVSKKRRGAFGFFLGELLFVSCIVLLAYNNSFVSNSDDFVANNSTTEIEQNNNNIEKVSDNNTSIEGSKGFSLSQSENETEYNSKNESLPIRSSLNEEPFNTTKNNLNLREGESTKNSTSAGNTTRVTNTAFTSNVSNIHSSEVSNSIAKPNEKLVAQDFETNQNQNIKSEIGNQEKLKSNTEIDSESKNSKSESEEITEITENKDSTETLALKPENKVAIVTRNKMKKLQFNFQFGGIAYNDFNLSQNNRDIKTSLFAGVEVEYMLRPNLTITLGMNGYSRKSDALFIDLDYQDKGFGEIETKNTYSYTDLYFIEVPVSLNYVINSRHKIGVGPTLTRLLTTKVNINELSKDAKNREELSNNSNELLYHYNTFELNNIGLNIKYQFMLRRVGINVGYTQGLNEFLNEKTFNSSRFNSLNKFNLSIKYRL